MRDILSSLVHQRVYEKLVSLFLKSSTLTGLSYYLGSLEKHTNYPILFSFYCHPTTDNQSCHRVYSTLPQASFCNIIGKHILCHCLPIASPLTCYRFRTVMLLFMGVQSQEVCQGNVPCYPFPSRGVTPLSTSTELLYSLNPLWSASHLPQQIASWGRVIGNPVLCD